MILREKMLHPSCDNVKNTHGTVFSFNHVKKNKFITHTTFNPDQLIIRIN